MKRPNPLTILIAMALALMPGSAQADGESILDDKRVSAPPVVPAAVKAEEVSKQASPELATSETKPQIVSAEKQAQESLRKHEFESGSKLFQSGKYKEALGAFSKAAQSGADDGEATIMTGYCHYHLKQYSLALKDYTTAADKGKLISIRNRAQKLAATLDSYMRGICPGNCLKPSMPGWHKMNVPGKPDRLIWMVFPYLDPAGKGGSEYWSNDQMGEVIEYINGRPVDKGICPICHGTGHVSLPK